VHNPPHEYRFPDPLRRSRVPPAQRGGIADPAGDRRLLLEPLHASARCTPRRRKKFRARDEAETMETLRRCGERFGAGIRRVFLADGDALVLPTRRLLEILSAIREHLPAVRRVSSYCLPRNLRKKSVAELKELAAAGLTMAYVGAESGDDEVLAKVNKGETFASTCEALDKLQQAGIRRSVMILNGLGGKTLSRSTREFGAPGQRHAARIPGHAGGEFPAGRTTLPRRIPGMAALRSARAVRGNGSLHFGAGTQAHRVPQRPRFQPSGAERQPSAPKSRACSPRSANPYRAG
jgi:hypothetical protein